MRKRSDPWKWPFVILVTVGFWLPVVFLVPRDWYDFLFASTRPLDQINPSTAGPWLALVPPPEIEVAAETEPEPRRRPPEPPPVAPDPDWWTRGLRVRAVTALRGPDPATPTLRDTLDVIMKELGIVGELTRFTKPDSVLAAALILLEREDSFRFDELKPYLTAVSRSRAYADIMSRAADMYDEFLGREIMVPD